MVSCINIFQTFFSKIVAIARNITGEDNDTTAVNKFRKILKQQKQYYNPESFPANESDSIAHKNCTSPDTAQKHCPKRWESFLTWSSVVRDVMGMLAPKLIPLFYHTGQKITIPNCPVEIKPIFNPSAAAQGFSNSDSGCTKPTNFYLPFFLENFGPKFSEWSVTAHEAWPGHHTQTQGKNCSDNQRRSILNSLTGFQLNSFGDVR